MKNIITPTQDKIIKTFSRDKSLRESFYLTGGTALAGFYLFHRFSEDLDFFSEKEFETEAIAVFLKENKKSLGFTKINFEQSHNRNIFFVHFGKEVVKIEFVYFPFSQIEPPKERMGIKIDSIIDIAANKLFAIYQRSQARDFIDLYFIIKKYRFGMAELLKKIRIKFDWHIDHLQLGVQFMKAREVIDYPRMLSRIAHEEWKKFFIKEAERLKDKILE